MNIKVFNLASTLFFTGELKIPSESCVTFCNHIFNKYLKSLNDMWKNSSENIQAI